MPTAFMRNLKKLQGGILMIDIHITGEGMRSQITNETAIDVMTALAEAVSIYVKETISQLER